MAIEKEAQKVNTDGNTTGPMKKLTRSTENKILAGVAAGIAKYVDMDPMIIRLLFVVFGLISGGIAIILYIVLALVLPEEGKA